MSQTPPGADAADAAELVACVARWLERMVVDFNLCPFAAKVVFDRRVRLLPTAAETTEQLLGDLEAELMFLSGNDNWETSLLIHPRVLGDFYDYNQFLDLVDELLRQMDLEGVFQVASFHPHYQFAGTEPDAAENYSSRSPYPLLHILREASIERAVAGYPDVDQIPLRNIERLNGLGAAKLRALWQSCFQA